jgi:hypothetical protein
MLLASIVTAAAVSVTQMTGVDPATVLCKVEDPGFTLTVADKVVYTSADDTYSKFDHCVRAKLAATANASGLIVDQDSGNLTPEGGYVISVDPEQVTCDLNIEQGFVMSLGDQPGMLVRGDERVNTYFSCASTQDAAKSATKNMVIDLEVGAFSVAE